MTLTGCGGAAEKPAQKKITFGVSPGPYGDMIRYAIKPGLEKKGYTVELKEFSDWVQPNL
ncbi:MAG TPA: MetQ/NlpA family ABC transporter substrate-binding protein, partial [Negativicutes bacterium]|nr:MetQ/NlpA family ABC transporter substrate-binding protein [Negativicutes bacterium]